MKINWKQLAQSPGYKSLKAAYTHDVQDARIRQRKFGSAMRDKPEFLNLFNWVINRAKHYAQHTGKPMDKILNEWEEKRDYWWLGYYQDARQPKFHSGCAKPMGVNGYRKYQKGPSRVSSHDVKHIVCSFIQRIQAEASKKAKPRWPMRRKKRGY